MRRLTFIELLQITTVKRTMTWSTSQQAVCPHPDSRNTPRIVVAGCRSLIRPVFHMSALNPLVSPRLKGGSGAEAFPHTFCLLLSRTSQPQLRSQHWHPSTYCDCQLKYSRWLSD